MEAILRIYLPLFLIGFIVLVFIIPTIKVYRQTGINPFRLTTNHDLAHDYIGASMKVFIGLLLITVLTYSFLPGLYEYFVPFYYLNATHFKMAGLVIGHIATAGIIVAQYQMNHSWRIGIDYENKTKLVTTGLFALSRNPIFLFMLIAFFGLFLTLPNAMTFALLMSTYFIIQVQIRLEEEF